MWITFVRNFIFVNYCKHKNITEIVNTFVKKKTRYLCFIIRSKILRKIYIYIYIYIYVYTLYNPFLLRIFRCLISIRELCSFQRKLYAFTEQGEPLHLPCTGCFWNVFSKIYPRLCSFSVCTCAAFPSVSVFERRTARWQIGHWRSGRV